METFLQDLRYGVRMLAKKPGFTAAAVLALTLGIGANSAIFSVLDAVVLRPLPFSNPDRLVSLWSTSTDQSRIVSSYPDFADFRDQSQTLEHVASYTRRGVLLLGDEEPELVLGTIASSGLFSVLGSSPLLGRGFSPGEDRAGAPRVIVISYELWKRRFGGDPGVIGKQMMLGDKQNHTVIGVMPPRFNFPIEATRTDFLLPLASRLPELTTRRSNTSLRMVARLNPDATIEQARADVSAIAQKLEQQYPESNTGRGATVIALSEDIVRDLRFTMLVLVAAVGFVLLIACANVGNLLLARALARQKEIAIRIALGASRGRIIRQLLTESILLSLVGGALGLLLALWGLDVLVAASPLDIPRISEVGLDARVLGFTVMISALTGLIFGLAPVFGASKPDLNDALKEGGCRLTGALGRNRVRGLLVISEIALSLVLLIGAGLLVRSFINLLQTDLGFNTRNALVLNLFLPRGATEDQSLTFFEQVIERARGVPGVQSVGMIDYLPFGGLNRGDTFLISGRAVAAGQEPAAGYRTISFDYFRAMGIPLRLGRVISEDDRKNTPPVVVVTQAFVRAFFPDESAIGKRISLGEVNQHGAELEIVGVVGDVRHDGVDVEGQPEFYLPFLQSPARQMAVVVRTESDNPASTVPALRSAIRGVNKEQYIPEITTTERLLANSVARRRFNTLLLGVFSAVAVSLATIGMYGVMNYSVAQRTHEIGIRIALGAENTDVLRLVVGQGMTLAVVGTVAGVAAALAATRILSRLLYSVTPTDALTFIVASSLLLGVALVACFVPARRATKVDPIAALRYE